VVEHSTCWLIKGARLLTPMASSLQSLGKISENEIKIHCGTVQGNVYDDRVDLMFARVPVTGSFDTSCLYFYESLTRPS